MDTNVLKTFIAVCEYSGFSAAAKELGYTQSTVSSQIKQLEKELDVRLFDRYYHKINLTEKGVLVLQQARNILKAQAKMLDSLNSAESIEGEIRLSMSSSVCSRYFKNDFLRFHHQYPEIKVEITENGTEQMFDKLRKNETDLVFTLDRHIYDSDFIICAEQEEQVHFIVDYILTELDRDHTLLLFISKNLSWGIFKGAFEEKMPDEDYHFYQSYLDMLSKSRATYENPELLLFTIIELVGSSCYSCILYQQPVPLVQYRPYLHASITAIMKTFEATPA